MPDEAVPNAREETILGDVPVSAKLALGAEHLQLFLTSQRIIVARSGKTGPAALATSSLLGRLGAGLEGLFGRKKPVKSDEIRTLSPEAILGLDKDNFQIAFSEIVDVELAGGSISSEITILTKDEKLVLTTPREFDSVSRLLASALGSKVRTSRLSDSRRESRPGRH